MESVDPFFTPVKDEPLSPEEIFIQDEEYSNASGSKNGIGADTIYPFFQVDFGADESAKKNKRTAEATTSSQYQKLPRTTSYVPGTGPSRGECSSNMGGIYKSISTLHYSAIQGEKAIKEELGNSPSEKSLASDGTGGESEEEGGAENSAEAVTLTTDGSFFKLVSEECSDVSIIALCVMCQPAIVRVRGSPESTEDFQTHLQMSHGDYVLNQYKRYIREHLSRSNSDSDSSTKKLLQETLDVNIARFILHSLVPLEIVENPFFNKIFNFFNVSKRGLSVPSKEALERRIISFYKKNLRSVKEELEKAQHVCTTTDIWRYDRVSYFGVAVHFLNERMQRVSAVLACEKFKGTHSYEKLQEWLTETQGLYGLPNSKIVATVTNSGFNYAKAFQQLGLDPKSIKFEGRDDGDTESDEEDPEELQFVDMDEIIKKGQLFLPNRSKCASQTLILCLSTDVVTCLQQNPSLKQAHDRALQKCNAYWRAAGKLKNEEIFKNILGYVLPRPVENRWNSLYDALKTILLAQNTIDELNKELPIRKTFCDSDFTYISEFLACTQPLTTAVEIIQSEQEHYYGVLFPTIVSLQHKLQRLTSRSWIFCEPLAKSYLNSVTNRFSKFINLSSAEAERAAIAAMSYPRFKRKWFIHFDEKYFERLTSLLRKNILEYMNVHPVYNVESKDEVWSRDDFFDFGSSSTSKLSIYAKADEEIAKFFNDDNEDISVLSKYEHIKKVFVKFNTPIASCAPVERLFPFAMLANSPHVNRLSNGMFEKRVILRTNLLREGFL